MIKQILTISLLGLTATANANDYSAYTPNDVYKKQHVQCPINKQKEREPQLYECLNRLDIYNYSIFIFSDENMTYRGIYEGDRVRGHIIPSYTKWAAV